MERARSVGLPRSQEIRTGQFGSEQQLILEQIACGAPLADVLRAIVASIELHSDGMCSILLLDAEHRTLTHAAAPRLPAQYVKSIDGSRIGPAAGSCGSAAYLGERVIVSDIATHPFWTDYRHLALPFGLRACWSTPILSQAREVLGTFAVYYGQPREPTPQELSLVDAATHLTSIAIMHAHLRAILHHQAGGRGHRARAVRGTRHRTGARRLAVGPEPSGARHHVRDLLSGGGLGDAARAHCRAARTRAR